MFDGSSEQFQQFIASSTTSLPFPLHLNPYAPPLHHHPPPPLPSTDPWSTDELLSLLKLRSTMEIWFPDFTWEHVSRKLGELGFKRSAEQCKEKFEEESRNFNGNSSSKSYRVMSELDELCHGDDQEREAEKPGEDPKGVEEEEAEQVVGKKASKKRKRRDRFERFKGFCEAVVKEMMAKQEHLHDKLIQDILRRDEETIARDEAWRSRETERIRAQIETRTEEHNSSARRQAAIVEFLGRFTSGVDNQHIHKRIQHEQEHEEEEEEEGEELNNNASNSSSSVPPSQNNNSNNNNDHEKLHPSSPAPPSGGGDEVGKRWPRDEVLALINLRCKMNGEQETGKEGSAAKGPLWERISQGMKEKGYKRSAKRCKEKWENINKYFRKTKGSSKKRSVNSRTCPYFHHLTSLYADGTIVAAAPENDAAAVVDLGGERPPSV